MPRTKKQSERTRRLLNRERSRRDRAEQNNKGQDVSNDSENESTQFQQISFTCTPQQIQIRKEFDHNLMSIQWNYCNNCNAGFPELTLKNEKCTWCYKNIKKFTKLNNMDPGKVPDHLPKLNDVEQMLIALNHPMIVLYRKRGGQQHYSGHIIHFPQDITTYTNKLPHAPNDLPYYVIFDAKSKSGKIELTADANKLRIWLIWLKENNTYYKHIDINEEVITKIKENEDLTSLIKHTEVPEVENFIAEEGKFSSFLPSDSTIDQSSYIAEKLHLQYPEIGTRPINEFSEVGYLSRSFPTLFPYGTADINDCREIDVDITDYFQYLMRYKDGRFANNERFLYVAQNTMQRHRAIKSANLYVRNRKFENQKIEDIRNAITNNEKLTNSIAAFGASLRGIRPYWQKRSGELLAMVEQLGQPHIFFTLSAADCRWPDIARIVNKTKEDEDLNPAQKANLVNKNPMLTSWYFYYRSKKFIDEVIKKLFDVTDLWCRYEWQARGSPHLHGVLWIKNAPTLSNSEPTPEKIEELCEFYDDLSFAWNVDAPKTVIHPSEIRFASIEDCHREKDLINLLNWLQKHTQCGSHCLRINRKTKLLQCRFKFPKPLQDKSSIHETDGYYQFAPARNDANVTRYHPLITMIWRANTDFSAIIGLDGILQYVAKYVAKCEIPSASFINIMKSICDGLAEDSSAKSAIIKLLTALVAERDYSAQEVCHIIMGWDMYFTTRNVIVINLYDVVWEKLLVSIY